MLDIQRHIEKSFSRLSALEYGIDNVWQKDSYDWPGDWEGRTLLAFNNLYECTGKKIPCMDLMIESLSERMNGEGFFGKPFNAELIDEQQITGQNWLLRGLLEYYKNFGSEKAFSLAKNMVENLYLKAYEGFYRYPVIRNVEQKGGVSGSALVVQDGWLLSSDIGCVYMCIDGLSDYYSITSDSRVYDMLVGIIDLFAGIDRIGLKCQTHATLSACRGIIKFYKKTGDKKYLDLAEEIFGIYVKHGMTLNYENYNWFGRSDTWTEPCAVVDSLIVAGELYKLTDKEDYKTLTRRIWFNGLQFCHKNNGGAGPDTCATLKTPFIKMFMYEAPFCCTMRYCEGLRYVYNNQSVYDYNSTEITKDVVGRRFWGDILMVKDENGNIVPLDSNIDNTTENIEKRVFHIIY